MSQVKQPDTISYNAAFSSRPPVIGIAGNIGAGKTTVVEKIAKHYGITKLNEPVLKNPYLADFYVDYDAKVKPSWNAFAMQIYLLNARLRHHQKAMWSDKPSVMDRTIYEDVIFALTLYQKGYIAKREFDVYCSLFDNMLHGLATPQLLIYLDVKPASALERINERDRSCEKKMSLEYLEALEKNYKEWLNTSVKGKFQYIVVNWEGDLTDAKLEALYKQIDERVNLKPSKQS